LFINRAITVTSIAGGVISIILSFLYANPVFPLIAAVFFAFSILVWKYGYLFIPLLTKGTNIVEVRSGYHIPPSRDSIIRKTKNGYYSITFGTTEENPGGAFGFHAGAYMSQKAPEPRLWSSGRYHTKTRGLRSKSASVAPRSSQ